MTDLLLQFAISTLCVSLVLSAFAPNPRTYANALLTVVEFLASPAIRPPAVASEMNSGGFLERRFQMIVSNKKMNRTPRWLRAGIVIGAMALLPFGVAYGQDYDAIGKRLGEAVQNGELSREQAGVMMEALRRGAAEGRERRFSREDYARIAADLEARVEAGEITAEAARKRLDRARQRVADPSGQSAERTRRIAVALSEAGIEREKIRDVLGAMRRITAQIQTEGERFKLDRRMAAYLKELGLDEEQLKFVVDLSRRVAASGATDERRVSREDYAKAEAKLKAMVEAGEISEEDAKRRLGGMRRMIGEGAGARADRRISREEYAKTEAEFKKAVAAGRISEEDAKTRLAEMRRMIGASASASGGRDVDWEAIKQRIEGAVEAGKMTRDEADEAYRAIRERMAGDRGAEQRERKRDDR